MPCHFCNSTNLSEERGRRQYLCVICGHVYLTQDCTEDLPEQSFSGDKKKIISIWIRNEYERRKRRRFTSPLTLGDLHRIVRQYRPMDAIEKMDNALLNLHRKSEYIGHRFSVNITNDFPYYHCFNQRELHSVLLFLSQEGFIFADDPLNPHNALRVATKGYHRLIELQRLGKDSRQCFVAMWLAPEMNRIYEDAIEPAIEYTEEDETEPRFKAIKIDNEEHTNDINDEIIAQIRRSRFMVCDLTGYRGGVYFEAGFAYGLGLEVIYTCREDWVEKEVNTITDSEGENHKIVQEGIHFDLEHRPHIKWMKDNLSEFQDKLTKRIKAVIV